MNKQNKVHLISAVSIFIGISFKVMLDYFEGVYKLVPFLFVLITFSPLSTWIKYEFGGEK